MKQVRNERHLPAAHAVRKDGGCNGRNPGYGQSCRRAGLSTSRLWFLSVRNRGTIKPYDPVTTEVRRISAANEMA